MSDKIGKNKASRIVLYLVLAFLTFVFIFPVVWIIGSSFKNSAELFTWPPTLFGSHPTLDNYVTAFQEGNFSVFFLNTVFTSVVATILTVIINVMSGYVFAKYHFKGDKLLFGITLATLMVPLEVIMIPIFKVIVATHLYNSLWGLIIPAAASRRLCFWCGSITSAFPAPTWRRRGSTGRVNL